MVHCITLHYSTLHFCLISPRCEQTKNTNRLTYGDGPYVPGNVIVSDVLLSSFSVYVLGCPVLSERPIKMQYSIDTPVQKPVFPPEKLWEAASASLQGHSYVQVLTSKTQEQFLNFNTILGKTHSTPLSPSKTQASTLCKEHFLNFNTILGKHNSTALSSSFDSDDIPQTFSVLPLRPAQ